MSNFMCDAVLAEKIGVDVWKTIVKRFIMESAVTGNPEETKKRFNGMVNVEAIAALEELKQRTQVSGQSQAEFDRESEELAECLNTTLKNIKKNYMPVILRAFKDGVPLLDENGIPKGKSRLEADYKAIDAEDPADVKAEKDPQVVAEGLWTTFKAYCSKYSIDADSIINNS